MTRASSDSINYNFAKRSEVAVTDGTGLSKNDGFFQDYEVDSTSTGTSSENGRSWDAGVQSLRKL